RVNVNAEDLGDGERTAVHDQAGIRHGETIVKGQGPSCREPVLDAQHRLEHGGQIARVALAGEPDRAGGEIKLTAVVVQFEQGELAPVEVDDAARPELEIGRRDGRAGVDVEDAGAAGGGVGAPDRDGPGRAKGGGVSGDGDGARPARVCPDQQVGGEDQGFVLDHQRAAVV